MASLIDATKPIEGTPTTASVRQNFAQAKTEIETLQTAVATAQGDASQAITNAGAAMTRNEATLRVQQLVRNNSGVGMTKGQVVYINGGVGQVATVALAKADAELTSKSTLGLLAEDIANNANGYATISGELLGVDTSLFNEGDRIALSPTVAGGWTNTKPLAPYHLTYVAVCVYSHATQGKVVVEIKGGFELDEIHDCQIITPTDGQVLQYDAASGLWKNAEKFPGLTWTNATLINGWVNYGGEFGNAKFAIDNFGIVYMTGLIKDGAIGSPAFVLPVNMRPATSKSIVTNSAGIHGVLKITSTGDVIPTIGSTGGFSLDGTTFPLI